MQTNTDYETEKTDRVFEIEINGKAVPCAEAHIKRAVFGSAHKEINTFYTRLCEEFLTYAEKTLAPEFAGRFTEAETVRERCALKIPVLSVSIYAHGEHPLAVITEYTLFYGARPAKKDEILTKWNTARGVMVKERANKKGST